MTIGLFYAIETISQALANHLKKLLDQDGLTRKIIAYEPYGGTLRSHPDPAIA
jgi:hypothetical protein